MPQEHIAVLKLLQVVFSGRVVAIPKGTDWAKTIKTATSQGVLAVCYDAFERLRNQGGSTPDVDTLMDWMAKTEHEKTLYTQYVDKVASLADFYRQHGIKMMLLKGYGLSLNYPTPSCRPVGDIDVYLFGEKERGDELVEHQLGITVEKGYDKHSSFHYKGVVIENHETYISNDTHASNVRLDAILKTQMNKDELIKSPIPYCYLPSATWNAIYLLRHAGEHFATNEIFLRHVLDLGAFYLRFYQDIDWERVLKVYADEGMMPFYDAIATICVRDIGMEAQCFKDYHHNESLADKVLADIFAEKKELPMNGVGIRKMGRWKYGFKKTIRWWHNRWKYKMVYNESMWQSFYGLAKNRLKHM